MLIRLTRGTVVDGLAYEAGAVVDTAPATAGYLVAIGKAMAVDPGPITPAAEPERAQVEAPERTVQPRGRGRKEVR